MTRELRWGETPWDHLNHEELLRTVQRLYAALQAASGVVDMARTNDAWPHLNSETPQERIGAEIDRIAQELPFWGKDGRGGRAHEMARQALELDTDYGDTLYRSFFRYAHDLLFHERSGVRIGFGWVVCDTCGQMIGRRLRDNNNYLLGKPCAAHGMGKSNCTGVFRAIQWSDLRLREEPTP